MARLTFLQRNLRHPGPNPQAYQSTSYQRTTYQSTSQTLPSLPPHIHGLHMPFKFCTREEPLKESLNPAFQVATLRGHIPFQMPSSRAGQLALGQAGGQAYSMHRADLQQGLLPLPVISDRPPVLWTLMFVYQGQVECSPLG